MLQQLLTWMTLIITGVCCLQQVIESEKRQIAVIGSGAAGSSFSYFLNQLYGVGPVTVFDKQSRVGGRAHVLRLNETSCKQGVCTPNTYVVELGASIFAEANQHLMNATREFGLQIDKEYSDDDDSHASVGVWSGHGWKWLESPNSSKSWLSQTFANLKLLWHYGIFNGPLKATRLAKEAASKFNVVYDLLAANNNSYHFTNVHNLIDDLDISDLLSQTASDYFKANGISDAFINDFIGGITRTTYLQDMDSIHSFGSLISLFSGLEGMHSVADGNYRIFEHMLKSSKASVVLGTAVESINRSKSGKFILSFDNRPDELFDLVVLASPPGSVSLPPDIPVAMPRFEYIQLLVTVVVGELNPAYFGLKTQSQIPSSIMTPFNADSDIPFYSMSILHTLNKTQSIVKFFSPAQSSIQSHLDKLFVKRKSTFQHTWNDFGSYPYLRPSANYSLPVLLDNNGIVLINSFERFISTMETETIAGRNAAALVYQMVQ